MTEQAALVPTEIRSIEFYGDEIVGALVQVADEPQVYVPIRPICDYLGLSWSGQRERVMRDEVLSEAVRFVRVTRTNSAGGNPNVLALPLDLLPGFLFGVTASRVKEEFREKIIRYRRECYKRLWDVFKYDIVQVVAPLAPQPTGAALAYELATAVQNLAREQMELEQRISNAAQWAKGTTQWMKAIDARVNELELRLSPDSEITNSQAAELALTVKNVGYALERRGVVPGYPRVYAEMYRRYRINSYKNLPQAKYDEVLRWLGEWYDELDGAA